MVIKKILMLILTISIFAISGNALERKKPLPLKELQNPNGPSYVPIPYPKTNNDVIVDLKYFLKFWIGEKKQGNILGNSGAAADFESITSNYLKNNGITVGEIVKVYNDLVSRERDYSFLIRLKNTDNYDVARFGMLANGIMATWSHIDLKDLSPNNPRLRELVFKPFLDIPGIKNQIKSLTGKNLEEKEVNKIRLVEGQSLIGDLTSPALEVRLDNGRIFYKSYILHAIYELDEKLDATAQNLNEKRSMIMRNSGTIYQFFEKNAIGEELILKEVNTEK